MRRKAMLLLATMGMALVVALTACESESTTSGDGKSAEASGDERYDVQASMASLQEAGWEAMEPEEAQETYTVPQTGYLEATAPDGEPIDLQFFESPEDAQGELDATREQEAPFDGTTVGNVLVFDPEAETAAVSPGNLEELQGLLR